MLKYPLVLEGGGLRGVFTAGILEYFLENDIEFSKVIGVSAGACIGASYISKQKGRNFRVNVEIPSNNWRFVGLRSYLTTGSFFGMNFVFNEVPNKIDLFDFDTFLHSKTQFEVVTTSLETGEAVVFEKNDCTRESFMQLLIASSSIPFLSKTAYFNDKPFLDGGISDSIPVKRALEQSEKAVVILTRPRDYRKKPSKLGKLIKWKYRNFPEFSHSLENRFLHYNQTLEYINEMERSGRLFVIAPEEKFVINRLEKKYSKLKSFYSHGYNKAISTFDSLNSFFQ